MWRVGGILQAEVGGYRACDTFGKVHHIEVRKEPIHFLVGYARFFLALLEHVGRPFHNFQVIDKVGVSCNRRGCGSYAAFAECSCGIGERTTLAAACCKYSSTVMHTG